MKKLFLSFAIVSLSLLSAQTGKVGINTESPQATLDVVGTPSNSSKLDGIIPPRITAEQLKEKVYTLDQKGAFVYVTEAFAQGAATANTQTELVTETGYFEFDGSKWKPFEDDTLADVVNRDNYSPKFITFTGPDKTYERDGAIGMNPSTYSMYFGNMNPAQTGYYNLAFGYETFPTLTTGGLNSTYGHFSGSKLTTGSYNALFGNNAGSSLTTAQYSAFFGYLAGTKTTIGNSNSFFGDESGGSNVIGYKNSFFGMASGFANIEGGYNSGFGYKVASARTLGNFNALFGPFSGSASTVRPLGSFNVLIGSGAGFDDLNLNNKLIIHSNNSLTVTDPNSSANEGVYTDRLQSQLANALVTGDFQERWFKLNGNLRLNPTLNPSDATYTQTLVAKADGTVGITDQSDHLTTAGTQPNKPIYGQLEYTGGDTVGYPEAYGFYSENSDTVTGFTIQDDGALTPSMYFLDKNKGNEVASQIYLSTEGIHLLSNAIYGSIENAIPTTDVSLVQKLWVENLVNSKITVPAPPATGNYYLTSVNGVMQWIAN